MGNLGRCHLEPMNLSRIQDNPLLSVALKDTDVHQCMESVKKYGLLNPLVLARTHDGQYKILAGSCELQALRKMRAKQTDAVIVEGLNSPQTDQLSLHLLSVRSNKDSLAEAFLIQKLLQDPELSQADVALMVGRSVSWVSKRALLAERLSPAVQRLVMDKLLPARTAQEIAKLPPKTQISFATKVLTERMPKSAVERLVAMYNRPDTTGPVKRIILEKPKDALPYCVPKQSRQMVGTEEDAKEKHLRSCIQLLLKLTAELESMWAAVSGVQVWEPLQRAVRRLSSLPDPTGLAPGQEQKGELHVH